MRVFFSLFFALALNAFTYGFEPSGSNWEFPNATFHVGIPGFAPSGESWNSAFKRAMQEWSESTIFEFTAVDETLNPCTDRSSSTFGDGVTGVGFSATQCFTEFGSNVLAVTLKTLNCLNQTCTGRTEITDADIVFNETVNWDIYSGALQSGVRDFHRVALHELGHALGLDHEADEVAIMQPLITSLDSLSLDDINGANFIYGGDTTFESIYGLDVILPRTGEISTSSSSLTYNGSLSQSDQRFQNKPLDVYQFTLTQDYSIDLRMTSDDVNSVLYLARVNAFQEIDPEFSFSNDNFGFGQDSRIAENLQTGTYWVGVTGGSISDFGNYSLSLLSNALSSSELSFESFESVYGATVQLNSNPVIDGNLAGSDFSFDDRFLDIYEFTLNTESSVKIDLEANQFDTNLILVQVNEDQSIGQISLQNDDNGSGTNSTIEATIPSGRYWIGATSFSPGETGDYRITTAIVIP